MKKSRRSYRDKNFDSVENARLVEMQHKIHEVFRRLVQKNGIQIYIDDVARRRKVVQYYLTQYGLINTSVESYWCSLGGCILIGKGW